MPYETTSRIGFAVDVRDFVEGDEFFVRRLQKSLAIR
jgi:hypothetical protein